MATSVMAELSTDARPMVVLFTKNPVPGRVKTRLIGALTAEQAAQIHAAFVGDVIQELSRGSYRLRVAWALDDGDEPAVEMLPPASQPIESTRQSGRDLGERLFRALLEGTESSPLVAVVGSDHPGIDQQEVEKAFVLLAGGVNVVLGPATDGGYYLIAVRAESLDQRLFEGIDWSTSAVLEQTLGQCRQLGLEVAMLAPGSDVDTAQDLERLARDLRQGATVSACTRSRQLLRTWGRL